MQISLNTEKAVAALGGNMGLYKKILVRFKDSYGNIAETVANHIQVGEMQDAERMAHTIKGLAGNIGAEPLVQAALNLEMALREKKADLEINSAVEAFAETIEATMIAIEIELAS